MIISHEDAYWPDNLSLFTVNWENYREPKNKIMGKYGLYGLYLFWGSPINQFCFIGCPGKRQKTPFFEAPFSQRNSLSFEF